MVEQDLDRPMEPGANRHHPKCDSLVQVESYPHRRCNCVNLLPKARMTEPEKAKALQAARKEYLRTHTGSPAQVEDDSWIAVYRKALDLANQ